MGESKQTKLNRAKGNRERRAWLKDNGFCIACGSNYNEPGYVLCKQCMKNRVIYDLRYDPTGEKRRTNNQKRRLERAAAGLCTECGRPALPGLKVCWTCRERRRECVRMYKLRKRLERQAKEMQNNGAKSKT